MARTFPSSDERLLDIHRLYRRHRSLADTARELGLSRERVRQLLGIGASRGLFVYPPRKRKLPSLPTERLLGLIQEHGGVPAAARRLRIARGALAALLKRRGISRDDVDAAILEGRRRRYIERFNELRGRLGRVPRATDMQKKGQRIYRGIVRLWGSIAAFRDDLGVPAPGRGRLPRE